MQDKRLHIDKDFVDQAWRNMNGLLDEEMPVSNGKKRRFAVWTWWGIALFCLLVFGTALGLTLSNGKKAKTQAIYPTSAIASTGGGTNVPNDELKEPTNGNAIFEKKEKNNIQQNRLTTNVQKDQKLQSKAPRQSKPTNKAADTPSLLNPPNLVIANASHENQVIHADQLTPDNASITTINSTNAEISSLKSNFPTLVAPTGASNVHPKDMTVEKRHNWDLGIAVSGMSAITNKGAGYSTNFFASRKLGNPRWSIAAGLGYTYLEQPLSVIVSTQEPQIITNGEVVEDVEYGYFDNTSKLGDNSVESGKQGIRTDYDQPLRLHYAIVPIGVSHRIGTRLSLTAGIQASVLLHSKSDFVQGGAFGNASPTLNEQYGQLDKPVKISLFDVAATGNIGFLLSPNTSLELGYKLGLIDVLPNNNFKDKNQMAFLGLRYQF